MNHSQRRKALHAFSEDAFDIVLQRERARSDRYGPMFTLVTFRVPGGIRCNQRKRYLINVLSRRMRLTDVLATSEGKQVTLLLPGTGQDGANRLTQDVLEKFASFADRPGFSIQSYPRQF